VVADTVRRGSPTHGLQPLNVARHWRQVLELIQIAFGESLDAEARRALQSMQLPPLLGPVIGLLDAFSPPGEGMMPGFVWLEGGRVVGTASARRVRPYAQGWLISNVAVHPDWQGRGIGRALMEASLDFAESYGSSWVVLQVREENTVARRLYESLGFKAVDEVVRRERPGVGRTPPAKETAELRPARWSEGNTLARMARRSTPHDVFWTDALNQDIYRTGPLDRLANRLKGMWRQWWVLDESMDPAHERGRSGNAASAGLRAAVGIERDLRIDWSRLRLLIPPESRQEDLADVLISFGLRQLERYADLSTVVDHPASDQATQAALARSGFDMKFALVHMRLNVRPNS
jgi:ribosomal protein S18 acetylase RimI-like enzyme